MRTHHGERLATSRLSIHKYGSIDALQGRQSYPPDLLVVDRMRVQLLVITLVLNYYAKYCTETELNALTGQELPHPHKVVVTVR